MVPIEHIHPMLVHFPIVFFLSLTALDFVARLRGAPITGRSSVGNISTGFAVLAALFAIVAFMLGDEALEIAEAGGFFSEIAETHELLGTLTAVILSAWAVIRVFMWMKDIRVQGALNGVVLLIEVAGSAVILTTAFYGGTLVYELGVNVMHAVQ